jgi:hypothetical protein
MTQYLLSVHHGAELGFSAEEMQQSIADVDAFNQELLTSGHWVFAGGLHPADTATVVCQRDGQAFTTDGPYLESKEHLGGFWIIDAADIDAALEIGARASKACWLPVEVRPFMAEPPS